jgi:hypothetical protein
MRCVENTLVDFVYLISCKTLFSCLISSPYEAQARSARRDSRLPRAGADRILDLAKIGQPRKTGRANTSFAQ